MRTLIVIPARYGSTRFPGKPLASIAGKPMLNRVVSVAQKAKALIGPDKSEFVVATDNDQIFNHCAENDFPCVMTDPDLPSGTDRAFAALEAYKYQADVVLNLQGDAPFTPPAQIASVAAAAAEDGIDAATPYVQLSWEALDQLREHKKVAPFSGTTLIRNRHGNAIWFSKNIIPAIRKETALREKSDRSPVCRHIGLYGFKRHALEQYVSLDETPYEKLEGLEQLRLLESGMSIKCVEVDPPRISMPGIDTPEDLALAELLIKQHGEPFEE